MTDKPFSEACSADQVEGVELSLLFVVMGEQTVVKVEKKGGRFEKIHVIGLRLGGGSAVIYCDEGEVDIVELPFPDIRAAVDTLEGEKPPDLLPCPFCEGEAYWHESTSDRHYFHVACNKCDVVTVGTTTREFAYRKWNTRPDKPLPIWTPKRGEWKQLYPYTPEPGAVIPVPPDILPEQSVSAIGQMVRDTVDTINQQMPIEVWRYVLKSYA